MRGTRAERRAALEAQAKAVIDELLRWEEETKQPTLTQMEEEILQLRTKLSEGMLESVIRGQESRRPVPGPACPKCGQEMQYKDEKGRRITSRVGTVALERGYYYCSHCKESLFPPRSTTAAE